MNEYTFFFSVTGVLGIFIGIYQFLPEYLGRDIKFTLSQGDIQTKKGINFQHSGTISFQITLSYDPELNKEEETFMVEDSMVHNTHHYRGYNFRIKLIPNLKNNDPKITVILERIR